MYYLLTCSMFSLHTRPFENILLHGFNTSSASIQIENLLHPDLYPPQWTTQYRCESNVNHLL